MEKVEIKKVKGINDALFQIMADIDRIEKDSVNTFQNYQYASEKIIKEKIHTALVNHEVLFRLNVIESKIENGLTWTKFGYVFTHVPTGQYIEGVFMGTGSGRDDKGFYASITGAIKYIMTSTFLIPTGDDPEKTESPVENKVSASSPTKETAPQGELKEGSLCPECQKGIIVAKSGQYGTFYGCNNYPECKYILKKS